MQQKIQLPKFIPELDGLRAVAILAVMLFHLKIRGFSLGWAGVNLFFVISGFLITGILLDTKKLPLYFRNFYIRRALRIFPIYYLMLSIVVGVGLVLRWNLSDTPFYFFYMQNYDLGWNRFSASFPSLLDHTWSLAIEEQFYLLWPLVVFVLSRRQLLAFCIGLFPLAFLTRALVFVTTSNRNLLYTPLPTQVDSLIAGAVLALIVRSNMARTSIARKAPLMVIATGGVIGMLVVVTGLSAYWSPYLWAVNPWNLPMLSLMALFFGSILAFAVLGDSIFSNFLRSSWLGQIGRISYGLYLYHYPVYGLVDGIDLRFLSPLTGALFEYVVIALKILLTYIIALFSWNIIEARCNALKDRFAPTVLSPHR